MAGDHVLLRDTKLKKTVTMMGTTEDALVEKLTAPAPLDGEGEGEDAEDDEKEGTLAYACQPENLAKVEKRAAQYKIEVLSPPRPGRRLLVLDIDYTVGCSFVLLTPFFARYTLGCKRRILQHA